MHDFRFRDFRFWCQKVLPLVYDDSLSYYEVLCKVVQYLNGLIGDTTELSKEVAELREYVEHIDVDIETAVDEAIAEMIQDGSLDNIIAPIVHNDVNQAIYDMNARYKSQNISIGRLGRLVDDYRYGASVLSGQSCTTDGTYYYGCGGYSSNTVQKIAKFNSVGELAGYESYSALGHANDIAYFDGNLYVANGGGNTLGVVNASTLALSDSYTYSAYSNIFGVTTDGEKVYVLANKYGLYYLCEVDGSSITEKFRVYYPSNAVPQGLCYYNGNFYAFMNVPNAIMEYDASGNMNAVYYVPDNDGYFPAGELETGMVINDKLCIFTTSGNSASFRPYASQIKASYCQIFETSINGQTVNGSVQVLNVNPLNITVNGNASFSFNPISTFTTLEEASVLLQAHGNGRMNVSNVSGGCLMLTNGDYNIVCSSGDRIKDSIVLISCTAMITQATFSDGVTCLYSDVNFRHCSFSGACSFTYSNSLVNDCWFNGIDTLGFTRSSFEIENLGGNLKDALVVTMSEAKSGRISYSGRYRENLIKLFAATGVGSLWSICLPNVSNNVISVGLSGYSAGSYETGNVDDEIGRAHVCACGAGCS